MPVSNGRNTKRAGCVILYVGANADRGTSRSPTPSVTQAAYGRAASCRSRAFLSGASMPKPYRKRTAPTLPAEQLETSEAAGPTVESFDELNLSEPVRRAVAEAGFETPTPIQARAIPLLMEGRSLIGQAQTGT